MAGEDAATKMLDNYYGESWFLILALLLLEMIFISLTDTRKSFITSSTQSWLDWFEHLIQQRAAICSESLIQAPENIPGILFANWICSAGKLNFNFKHIQTDPVM